MQQTATSTYIPKVKVPRMLDFDWEPESPQQDTQRQRQRDYIEAYRADWLKWIREWLHVDTTPWPDDYPPPGWTPADGYPLWSKQVEIIRAVQEHRKVAVRSSHDIGKTFIAAIIALTLHYLYQPLGITTAPTFRQVKKLLWGEVHKVWGRAERLNRSEGRSLGGQLNKTSLDNGGKWVTEGFSTDKDYNQLGFHETTIFLIMDEACQVPRDTYDTFEDSVLTNEGCYVLLIGNPLDTMSPFRACFEPGSEYYQMKVDSWDTPNVRHQENIYPMLVAKDYPERMLAKYKDVDHPFYRGKVRAEFPLEGEDQLIKWEYIQAAQERSLDPRSPYMSIGLDVSRKGQDMTEYGARQMNGRFRIYRETAQERDTETAGRVILDLQGAGPLGDKLGGCCVNVDDIGVGGGVSDILFEGDYPVNEIVVSEGPTPDDLDEIDADDDSNLFLNKRAVFYWKLREAFMAGEVDIDPLDIELAEELHTIQKKTTGRGKIQIISKDDIRDLLGRSPNRADCMMLAWAKDEDESGGDLIREI